MTRLASFAFLAAFLAAACTVGEPGDGGGGGGPPPPGDGPDAAPPADQPDGGGNATDCVEPVASTPDGHHNAGLNCMGCHGTPTVGNAPHWFAAGTLYTSADGAAPLAGATVIITDNGGQEVSIVTASNGNFWTPTPLEYPLTVKASRCPDTKAMVSSVGEPASCNGCHTAGGTPGRIHLP